MNYVSGYRLAALIAFLCAIFVGWISADINKGIFFMVFACYCALQMISAQLGEKK